MKTRVMTWLVPTWSKSSPSLIEIKVPYRLPMGSWSEIDGSTILTVTWDWAPHADPMWTAPKPDVIKHNGTTTLKKETKVSNFLPSLLCMKLVVGYKLIIINGSGCIANLSKFPLFAFGISHLLKAFGVVSIWQKNK
jgi:hypothetical protein